MNFIKYARDWVSQMISLVGWKRRSRQMVDNGAMDGHNTTSFGQSGLMVVALWSIWAHLQGQGLIAFIHCEVGMALESYGLITSV